MKTTNDASAEAKSAHTPGPWYSLQEYSNGGEVHLTHKSAVARRQPLKRLRINFSLIAKDSLLMESLRLITVSRGRLL